MMRFHGKVGSVSRARIGVSLLALMLLTPTLVRAQAALLLEEPYGAFGRVNPTGHAALFLEHICAATAVTLRPCRPGEAGVVISRYKDMGGYDWVAIPLLPYLYAVDDPAQMPSHVDRKTIDALRDRYREAHLGDFGSHLRVGGFFSGGWSELTGAAYNRRIFALRFDTNPADDERLMKMLNQRPNKTHFGLFYSNCADFDRLVLENYFPGQFHRAIFPDAGMTTPKQISHKLLRLAAHDPAMHLRVFEISQIAGYRKLSHPNHGVMESFLKNGLVLPVVALNPYFAGGLLADYLVEGRYQVVPAERTVIDPAHLALLSDSKESIMPEPASPQPSTTVAQLPRSVASADESNSRVLKPLH